ncbi:MAG TPA: tRNA guanosine(34) transglycosylase Tgt [Candidatus Limnocylindria bacterium]|jgi:queuine tRNA-ribosyltransferase
MAEPLVTRRGTLAVPTFLPDATRAGVRGTSSEDLRGIGIEGLVVNAFHLLRRPGARVVQAAGGIHRFMDWDAPVLSDSGGFQVWSLIRQDPERGVIRDNEVIFREPSTGEKWTLTPERVVNLQFQLGSDIIVCLDDCTDADAPMEEQERSVERTVKWARRSREEFDRQADQRSGEAPRIFAVVQGGSVETLRRQCATTLAGIGFDGFGFGGWPLAGDGSLLAEPMRWVAESLPTATPKHALGVGRPDHVVTAFALGYSIFDCALPTRDARHGRLYAFRDGWGGRRPAPDDDFYRAVRIHDADHHADHGPIEDGCDCPVCARHSVAYLHHLFKVGDASAERLATLHNLRFYVRLFALLREVGPVA